MERRPRTSPGLLPGSAIFEALHFVWLVSACGTLKSRKWNIGTRNSKYPFVVLIIKVMFWLQNTSKTDRTASGNPSRTRNLRGMRNQLRSAFLLLSPRYFWSRRCIEPIAWNWAHDPANGWDSSTFDILIPISLKSLSARTVVAFEIVWSWSVNGIFRTVKSSRIRNWISRPEVVNCVLARRFKLSIEIDAKRTHFETDDSCELSATGVSADGWNSTRTAVNSRREGAKSGSPTRNGRLLNYMLDRRLSDL